MAVGMVVMDMSGGIGVAVHRCSDLRFIDPE